MTKVTFEIEQCDYPNDTEPDWKEDKLEINRTEGEYLYFIVNDKSYRIKKDLVKFIAGLV